MLDPDERFNKLAGQIERAITRIAFNIRKREQSADEKTKDIIYRDIKNDISRVFSQLEEMSNIYVSKIEV
jgi:hypothetical protein